MKVSIGVWLSGRMSAKDFAGYVVGLVIGATLTMVHLIGILVLMVMAH